MFGNHGLGGLPEEGAHEKSPKCLSRNLGDFREFCKGLSAADIQQVQVGSSLNKTVNLPEMLGLNPTYA
ncbi:hypothetical protein CYK00_03480 [Neisseria sicca]|uniref:Uncharacterized protein n=1 Tax=Neisseria sicca TaxID=490 RepID=A0A2I1XDQ8_NEISI|nr:hypothetical protein CYK00_03480 [Neisseria sicca]